ncbi:MAG: AAA family ATPase [Candidatus Omnitrophica bacterium]|nr:AAA family ATPase [Candidatus Omnitrophota bacterium]MDD5654810.1 AAA family ATPase [Candidatus Omnitrophota bacterium]
MQGKTIANRYKVIEEVSQDSVTTLCKGQDIVENKPVFIKFLKDKAKERPLETQLRFKRELDQISGLNHPNLLKVYSHGEFESQDYVIDEYIDAKPLLTYLGQSLPIDSAVEMILQVSSALDVAHQNGILHQALQPQNIFVTQDLKVTKLANFGYNLLIDISRISQAQEVISTFGYFSPESSGILRKPVDSRSDAYSLGVIFYQLITGLLPYRALEVSTLIHQHIAKVPEPPSKVNPDVPAVIENIVLRLIAKDPQDRYQSLNGLIVDLKEYQKQKAEGRSLVDFEIARFDKLKQLSFSTRLIGRDNELNQLKSLLDQTKLGKGNLSFVYGEPGIGKSRLVDELRGHIHGLGGLFCGGKCYQYEFRSPYKVFSEAIDAYIEKIKRLSHEEQQGHIKRINDVLGDLGGEVVKIAPNITDLIGQPPKLAELEPEKEKIRFLITVTNFIISLSTPQTPLLMFLDDLQWVDDGSLEILERVVEKIQNSSMLIIISYRDTDVDQNHPLVQLIKKLADKKLSFLEMPVKSFSLSETAKMVSQILIEKEQNILPLAEELQERAKGNPFFTLELLHSLVDSEVVFLKDDRYTYDLGKLQAANLPTSIVDAVLKRMKDLGEEELEIISYASIMGKEIEFKILTELASKPAEKIVASLEDGIRSQLLFRDLTGQENIFFMHDRIREAFYKRVPQDKRTPLHKHIAEVLEAQNKDNFDLVIYDLAHHFQEGGVEDKALQYSIPAAHKAKSSYSNTMAVSLYNTAKGILEKQNKKNTKEYIEVLENLGEVYRLSGRFDESLETLKGCESLIPREDRLYRAQVSAKMGDTLFEKGDIEESSKVLSQALGVAGFSIPQSKPVMFLTMPVWFTIQMLHMLFPRLLVRKTTTTDQHDIVLSHMLLRLTYIYYFSDPIKMFYTYLRGINFAESKIGPSAELAHYYSNGPAVYSTSILPWLWRALRDSHLGLKMAQDLQNKIEEGRAYAYLCMGMNLANDPDRGIEYGRKSIQLLQGAGEYWELATAYHFTYDFHHYLSGRLQEARKGNQELIAICRESKSLQCLGWALEGQCKIASLLGEIDEKVIAGAEESAQLLNKTRDKMIEIYAIAALGFAYMRIGDNARAIQEVERAMLAHKHSPIGCWHTEVFPLGAHIYLDSVINIPDLSPAQRRVYLRRARWFCMMSAFWGLLYKSYLGYSYQVNGTYLWLTGRKNKAVKTWEQGIKFLRKKTKDKYRLAYILLEEAKFLLQDNPDDKKALGYLVESKELFMEAGCKIET